LSLTHPQQLIGCYKPPPGNKLRNESIRAMSLWRRLTFSIWRSRRFCARLVRSAAVSARRAEEAIHDLMDLRIARYPHHLFLERIWQLRNNLSAYNAVYVGLTESLGSTLITRDLRLGSSSGHAAVVEVF
jgi:predicted nucleic acid-binding protein